MKNEFSRDITTMIKGLLAIGIVLHHLSQRTNTIGIIDFFQRLGAPIVSIFFFISGYGLLNSMLANREKYLNSFLKKRLLSVLIPFFLAVLVYQTISYLDTRDFQINSVFNDLFNGLTDKLLPFSWYVFEIIFFYLMFYILFAFGKRDLLENMMLSVLFTISTIYFLKIINFGSWWYVSCLAFPLGLLWKNYERSIHSAVFQNFRVVIVCLLSILLLIPMLGMNHFGSMLLFPLFIYIFTCYIYFPENKLFLFLGKISYEIYLVQGIAILFLRGKHIYIENNYVYIIISIITTIAFAMFLNKIGLILKKVITTN